MNKIRLAIITPVLFCAIAYSQSRNEMQKQAEEFLKMHDSLYQKLYAVNSEAYWAAATDVSEVHTGERIGADKAIAAFQGNTYILDETARHLKSKDQLDPLTVRQLQKVLYYGAHAPGTIPDVVSARVSAEAKQSATLDGFVFCLERQGDQCVKPISTNEIDDILKNSRDLTERKRVWEASKESGIALKPGLIELQKLRNRIAKETGFHSYFELEVSDYGMTVPEMMALNQKLVADLKPLYQQLHTWTKHQLAAKV